MKCSGGVKGAHSRFDGISRVTLLDLLVVLLKLARLREDDVVDGGEVHGGALNHLLLIQEDDFDDYDGNDEDDVKFLIEEDRGENGGAAVFDQVCVLALPETKVDQSVSKL